MNDEQQYVVICIDWRAPNIVERELTEEQARRIAMMYDDLALRCIPVHMSDPRILWTKK
jgi:hypothetical protein